MMSRAGIAWRIVFATLFAAAVVLAAPASGARAEAADEAVAGLKEAKVAFDITAGEAGRLLNILNTIDETREGLERQGVTPRFVLTFRGPATMLIQTDASRLKSAERETATKIATKLKQLRGAAGVENLAQCGIAMRGQKVAKEQVSPDVTIVENSWITLAGYQAKGYAYISP